VYGLLGDGVAMGLFLLGLCGCFLFCRVFCCVSVCFLWGVLLVFLKNGDFLVVNIGQDKKTFSIGKNESKHRPTTHVVRMKVFVQLFS
jgi:hypothetical protein